MKIYISKTKLLHNMKYLKNNFKKKILTIVKANAYGHDIKLITKILFENGYKDFAVARLTEALEIVKDYKLEDSKIVIFESIDLEKLKIIKDNINFHMSINEFEELEKVISAGIPSERVQLKIDFGFGRNGISLDKLEELKKYIQKNNLKFSGIYSHLFSVNYEEGLEIIKKFQDVIGYLGKERFSMVHLQNSGGVENFGILPYTTHIRIGMLVYGLQEGGFFDENIKLIFSLRGKIAGIRNLENSKYIAYNEKKNLKVGNCKYVAKIKFGYGDGFLKFNENTKCLIKNKEFNISLITMDNTFIEVDSSIKVGDEIKLYPNLNFIEQILKIKRVEILSILSPRVERVVEE